MNTLPNQPGSPDLPKDALEFTAGFPALIKARALPLGRKIEILDEKGRLMAAIKKNIAGNTDEKSYTVEFTDGRKMLLPVPYLCVFSVFIADVRENEDIELRLSGEVEKSFYRIHDPLDQDVSSVRPKVNEQHELSPEWREFDLADDQCLVFSHHQREVLAKVFKVAHRPEYILRDPQGNAKAHLFEGDEYEAGKKEGKRLQYAVEKGKFRIKGEPDLLLVVEQVARLQKTEAGRDGFLKGVINGGREIAVASYREVGRVKDSYLHRNEDNGGFNADTAAAGDGMGGNAYGPLASDFAVEAVLSEKGDFHQAVKSAHEKMDGFVEYCKQQEELRKSMDDGWFSQSGMKDAAMKEKVLVPDCVMAAVRFEGDDMESMVLGDAAVYVVRNGSVVFRTKEHSLVAQMVASGKMTKREALNSPLRSTVITTMVNSFAPDFEKFTLQAGDVVVLMSDGGILPDDVLLRCVKNGHSAESITENLLEAKREENELGGGYYDPGDGGLPVPVCSWDNTTYVVVRHD